MTKEDIIHFAKECSSSIYELCMNNPFFNTTECPIGANGLSDVVLNAVLNAFPKMKELASISDTKSLDEAAINHVYDGDPDKYGVEFEESNGKVLRQQRIDDFKAGANWRDSQIPKNIRIYSLNKEG